MRENRRCLKIGLQGIHLHFFNFWRGFRPQEFVVAHLIVKELSKASSQDFALLSDKRIGFWNFGKKTSARAVRMAERQSDVLIGFSWESKPSKIPFDFEIGHNIVGTPGSFRLPLFDGRLLIADSDNLKRCRTWVEPALLASKRELYERPNRFAAAVFSNATPERLRLVSVLGQLGQVDVYGKDFLPLTNKAELRGQYRYIIAAENARQDGYITEKLYDAYTLDSIPIYWGAPVKERHINPDSFLFACPEDGYSGLTKVIQRLEADAIKYQDAFNNSLILSVPDYESQVRELLIQLLASS